MRRALKWAVYGFLRWFESFDSVWQTTLLCVAGMIAVYVFPSVYLVASFTLVLSVYATFTQNGLAHGYKLNADQNKINSDLLLDLAQTMSVILGELRQRLIDDKEIRDRTN